MDEGDAHLPLAHDKIRRVLPLPLSFCTLITLIPVLNTLLPAHIRRLFAVATTGCPFSPGESAAADVALPFAPASWCASTRER